MRFVTDGVAWQFEEVHPGPFVWLQGWYTSQCDGDWEHQAGVKIETLDNPGWSLAIDLERTSRQGVSFERVEIHRSEHDWCLCWVDCLVFKSACGPTNLGEAIHTFRTWCQQ
jgi:elongation factor P hydroxylase